MSPEDKITEEEAAKRRAAYYGSDSLEEAAKAVGGAEELSRIESSQVPVSKSDQSGSSDPRDRK